VLVPLEAADVGELLAAGGEGRPRPGAAPVPVAEADFAPVVPRPGKVICVGLNYREARRTVQGHAARPVP
jgi:acylpyruvate hydrolase